MRDADNESGNYRRNTSELHRRSSDFQADLGAVRLFRQGRNIFRHDTFGDEDFWGGELRLHEAIAGQNNGGVGPGVSPATALALGLKVDATALPRDLKKALRRGEVDLQDPATTLALLQLRAVVGVRGFFSADGQIESVGIQCALCHSTVDDSFAPGIGRRLDGWPNRDLDVGSIIAAAPNLSGVALGLGVSEATLRTVLGTWGPGKFDAHVFLDGQAFNPEGESAAILIPPAFGLAGVNMSTYEGWGSSTYWNAFVANLEMHGQGRFYDPRLQDSTKFPLANGLDNVQAADDRITGKACGVAVLPTWTPGSRTPRWQF